MITTNKNIKNKWKLLSVVICVIILDLFFLYYIKYKNQGLSLHNFNFAYTGNLLNLIFTLILIAGIICSSFSKRNIYNSKLLLFYTFLMTAALLFAEFYTWIKISVPNYFIFEHPLKEVLKGILFSVYQFIQFIFISIVWLTFLGRKELLILRVFVSTFALIAFLLLVGFLRLNTELENKISKNDFGHSKYVGVVMGAAVWSNNKPSPSLASRADMAAELYKNRVLKKIQLTGGHAPGELSEAEVAYNYLKEKNIDSTNIWLEKKTTSTSEQVSFIKNELMDKKHLKNIIVISDSYHLARINEICKFYNIKTRFAASELNLSSDKKIYYKFRESIALLIFWFFAL